MEVKAGEGVDDWISIITMHSFYQTHPPVAHPNLSSCSIFLLKLFFSPHSEEFPLSAGDH